MLESMCVLFSTRPMATRQDSTNPRLAPAAEGDDFDAGPAYSAAVRWSPK